jgi:hypothetical protein
MLFSDMLKLKINRFNAFHSWFSSFACQLASIVQTNQCITVILQLTVDFGCQTPNFKLVISNNAIGNGEGFVEHQKTKHVFWLIIQQKWVILVLFQRCCNYAYTFGILPIAAVKLCQQKQYFRICVMIAASIRYLFFNVLDGMCNNAFRFDKLQQNSAHVRSFDGCLLFEVIWDKYIVFLGNVEEDRNKQFEFLQNIFGAKQIVTFSPNKILFVHRSNHWTNVQ